MRQCDFVFLLKIISVLAILSLICVPYASSLEVRTHRDMNVFISQNNLKGFFLDECLKKELSILEGIKDYFKNQQVLRWISDGGEYEDKPADCIPYYRSRNHFHNPIDNSGFSGIWDTRILSGISAREWAVLPAGTQSCGYFSWNDVREYFYQALTAGEKASRDHYFALTFRGVGQLMHLVQDMSVPEHVRNDGHYGSEDYEAWANSDNAPSLTGYSPVYFVADSYYSLNTRSLFDSGQYTGTNPNVTLNQSIGLSEYASANFLSPDTIFNKPEFLFPAYSEVSERIEPDAGTGENLLYLRKKGLAEGVFGERIEHLARATAFYHFLPDGYKHLALTVRDRAVYHDYAAKLMPRAIGYSSQLLAYFFRGKLDATMSPQGVKIKNQSNETMTGGRFELYYDDVNGSRTRFAEAAVTALLPNAEQTLSFSHPQSAVYYMIVYRGKLGEEENAVIGKQLSSEMAVITVGLVGMPKSVSLVWDTGGNRLERNPADRDDAAFQSWLQSKTPVQSQPMFGNTVYCGRTSFTGNGSYPSLCPQLNPGDNDIRDHTQEGDWNKPWAYGTGWDIVDNYSYDIKACLQDANAWGFHSYVTPQSFYRAVDIPGGPIAWSGIRTRAILESYRHSWTGAYDDPTIYGNFYDNITYIFYGPLGVIGDFLDHRFGTGDPVWGMDYSPVTWTARTIPTWNEGWLWDPEMGRSDEAYHFKWYSDTLSGVFSEHSIIDVAVIQFTSFQNDYANECEDVQQVFKNSWTNPIRQALVQAQAIYRLEGTAGFDWVSAGPNPALAEQILNAINTAYSINNVQDSRIYDASVSIQIVK